MAMQYTSTDAFEPERQFVDTLHRLLQDDDHKLTAKNFALVRCNKWIASSSAGARRPPLQMPSKEPSQRMPLLRTLTDIYRNGLVKRRSSCSRMPCRFVDASSKRI
eukprot:4182874-Pyramimonas_sp.AAC.1